MKELKVDAIRRGTVIDHIPAGTVFKIVELLGIGKDDQVMIGTNLASAKHGRKDVIKIENRILSEDELNSISLVGPTVTISIIEDFIPVKKSNVRIPDEIRSIISCPNRHCITNHEEVPTRFAVESRSPLKVRCCYCERVFDTELNKYISL
ncbi:MAG: aspartate carbamoyltransferase regulatory subunit [Spirochaetota bacterium]